METIWTAVGQYAFPIVMCVMMAWYVKYVEDKHREEVTNLNNSHKQEMKEVTEAIRNNTLALQHLIDYIGGGNEKD